MTSSAAPTFSAIVLSSALWLLAPSPGLVWWNADGAAGRPAAAPSPPPHRATNPGAPAGDVIKAEFDQSKVYPGTWREYWVYVPKQLDRAKPAPVMVFQDGLQHQRAPIVFDNLIHAKAIPPMVGVFVMHGRVRAPSADALDRMNRSYEYDSVSGDYARFLLDELLPHVAKTHGVTLSTDPNDRAIAGNSSGAIAAFAAAWQRPDAFRRVFSAIGTYVGLRGGNEFPVLIRKTEPKPIRVFLQDGRNDLNNYTGSWFIANQDMQSALELRGLRRHARVGRRRAQLAARHRDLSAGADLAVARLAGADQGEPRREVASGRLSGARARRGLAGRQRRTSRHRRTGGQRHWRAVLHRSANNRIHKVGLDGKVTVFAENTNGANGMMFGPDGRLYAGATRTRQIVAYDPSGKAQVLAEDMPVNDLAVNVKGRSLFHRHGQQEGLVPAQGRHAARGRRGIESPNGVLFSPDQTLLYVSDYVGQLSWVFQIQPDGSLAHKQRYFYVHMPDAATRSGRTAWRSMPRGASTSPPRSACRSSIRSASATRSFPRRSARSLSNVEFGGRTSTRCYVTNGDKVFKRKRR